MGGPKTEIGVQLVFGGCTGKIAGGRRCLRVGAFWGGLAATVEAVV